MKTFWTTIGVIFDWVIKILQTIMGLFIFLIGIMGICLSVVMLKEGHWIMFGVGLLGSFGAFQAVWQGMIQLWGKKATR